MNIYLNRINKYVNRYLSTKIVFVLDLVASVCASFVTLFLVDIITVMDLISFKFGGVWMVSSLFFSFVLIWSLRTYRMVIRHMTVRELGRFLLLSLLKVLLMGFVFGITHAFSRVLYVMMLGDLFLTFTAFFLLRVLMLVVYDLVGSKLEYRKTCMNVLIFGIDNKAVGMVSSLHNSPSYKIVGFLQHGKSALSHIISEMPVYYVSSDSQFQKIVRESEADAIIFVNETDIIDEKDRILRYAQANKIKTLFVPAIDELVSGSMPKKFRNIEIEDLLMRPEIQISIDRIKENFQGKTVLVTGAAGSIGSELCRQLAGFGVGKLVLFDNAETPMHNLRLELEEKYPDMDFVPVVGDVRILARLDYVFTHYKPQVVFHAAAYKHVPLMEENPCEAVLVNVIGSRNVADKCIEYDVEKMVMVSTDKAVNPTNIMGCTKRLAEIYVQSMGLAVEKGLKTGRTKFVTTRFGNVLGSNGSVIPRFRDQIAKGGPVTVTHPDITRFFMTIPEACRLVMEAATMSKGNNIFVFDMGDSVKIDDLARRMISLAGYIPDQDIMIQYSGLRPGEKLYEEVLSNAEDTIPTDHGRIRVAKVREYDYALANDTVGELERLSRAVIIPDMVRLMKRTVPEFVSNNSEFEVYDLKNA